MDRLRAFGREIAESFPNDARGYLTLARVYELTGELDVGIAFGLKAFRLQPEDPDTKGQVAELFARIGDFEAAARFEPVPGPGQLWLRRRYEELVSVAQDVAIEDPDDLENMYLLAFGYNAVGDFATAKYILEHTGLPPPDRNSRRANVDEQALAIYLDALQALGGNDALVEDLAESSVETFEEGLATGHAKSWWVNALLACAQSQLGRDADALDSLDRAVHTQGLPWTPLIEDSRCFKRLAADPRYKALTQHLEDRRKLLRDRLPATLREYGVADLSVR